MSGQLGPPTGEGRGRPLSAGNGLCSVGGGGGFWLWRFGAGGATPRNEPCSWSLLQVLLHLHSPLLRGQPERRRALLPQLQRAPGGLPAHVRGAAAPACPLLPLFRASPEGSLGGWARPKGCLGPLPARFPAMCPSPGPRGSASSLPPGEELHPAARPEEAREQGGRGARDRGSRPSSNHPGTGALGALGLMGGSLHKCRDMGVRKGGATVTSSCGRFHEELKSGAQVYWDNHNQPRKKGGLLKLFPGIITKIPK